jgi:hypothetical protein
MESKELQGFQSSKHNKIAKRIIHPILRGLLPVPEFYHIPVESDLKPGFDTFCREIPPVQPNEAHTVVDLGRCLVVMCNIKHDTLFRLQ